MTLEAAVGPGGDAGPDRPVLLPEIHIHLLKVSAVALGMFKSRGLGTVVIGWLAVLVVLYPLCLSYLGLKRRHPRSVLRWI